MTIRINNLVLDIDEDIELLKKKAAKKLRIDKEDIKNFKILKESIDARKKNNIKFNYSVEVKCDNEKKVVQRANNKDVKIEESVDREKLIFGNKKMEHRPVVVGMGPAGMFAALLLAENGYKPIVIERGEKVEDRTKSVENFWKDGKLNLESNVQFGEGGAGTFSDGKLTTRIKDRRCDFVLEEFVKAGAPEEITYIGKPHIGTDILKEVVKNIREKIIRLGGEVRFNSRLEDLKIKNNKLEAVIINGEEIPCEVLVLALGHSARDTYEMLFKRGVFMSPKPFAIGVRIEHSQRFINENQYGKFAFHPRLRAADYRLSYTSKITDRAVYSFCMCPGGEVVAAASEEERLVVNGMSYYKRDKENANSAIVVTVGEKDFIGDTPLKGMEFQRHYESLAYKLGGGNYIAPVQLVGDFLKDRVSTKLGSIKPTYRPGYEFADLRRCLPSGVIDTLKEGLIEFDKKIKGFASDDAVMTGVETRTSAPVKIERNEKFQSISLKGLYPCGEGAGFAGGIVSAAVDGMKSAEHIMMEYKPS
ncbi:MULTISPECIES: NAD(P)/FAD-dependent oxidoreductase [Clostridium]|uniref:D-amino acid dehydrogenase small subunit n=2 Tax=Clostridium TaxID=1485 RepID=A0A151AML5_9CLOT|nr:MULTISPECIES: NAD(P)/FAD-dependent oxidoreductase [Clostridium]KYH28863.1 D-amino acid dehydrogenase small subunit [Clostridium colicanis DSM 13634]MBE6043271.1 NAD(P)/FAD-dependent oxidoreductase [Clostridium thermopalmarium]PRR70111.1 D-amino acid dehydrogenase [Clostridium thermopalmarium DSM 5974]PVZ23126.1 hypothetical protein LX19_01624 [Clostridium thermopalmarium DSM 5974]